jgi:hypothetical protein
MTFTGVISSVSNVDHKSSMRGNVGALRAGSCTSRFGSGNVKRPGVIQWSPCRIEQSASGRLLVQALADRIDVDRGDSRLTDSSGGTIVAFEIEQHR